MKNLGRLIALMVGTGAAAYAAPVVTFALDPVDGLAQGYPGTKAGWGYTISTTSDWILIQSITFGDLTPVGTFSALDVPSSAASPGSPITALWSEDLTGLQYEISALALEGSQSQGVFTLTYDTFADADLTDQTGFGDTVTATSGGSEVTAEVLVAEAPEPATVGGITAGLAVFAWIRRRRRA